MNSQKKTWIAFLIVFGLGGVTGASLDGIYRLRSTVPASTSPVTISMRNTEAYFETLKRELTLSEEQSQAMQAVLSRTRDDYKAVCADVRPRYDVVRARAREQLRARSDPLSLIFNSDKEPGS